MAYCFCKHVKRESLLLAREAEDSFQFSPAEVHYWTMRAIAAPGTCILAASRPLDPPNADLPRATFDTCDEHEHPVSMRTILYVWLVMGSSFPVSQAALAAASKCITTSCAA